MPDDTQIFTVQPRFTVGDTPHGWASVDTMFRLGTTAGNIPTYGSEYRDAYLALEWMSEPTLAGAFSTWVEKAQTVEWWITGGRNSANYYARVLHDADGGAGWTYHEGACAIDYLSTDKGSMEELGREDLTPEVIQQLRNLYETVKFSKQGFIDQAALDRILADATFGRVAGIQHLDSVRMMRAGLPGARWRYYPETHPPVFIPDMNMLQVTSMPSARDRMRGFGYCAMSRLLDAKSLMLGYLIYHRQEIGDLPPELLVIINGLPQTTVDDSYAKYKLDRENNGSDVYSRLWWLGSDDPMNPVSVQVLNLLTSNKSFNYQFMVEWWVKNIAVNIGADVGEIWLLQSGESKTVQSVQAMKAEGKGVAKYLQEKERRFNTDIMPYGVTFEYDNPNDDHDKQVSDIVAVKVKNLKELASIGVDRQDPAFTIEEVRRLAMEWKVVPQDLVEEEVPAVFGAILKQMFDDDLYVVDRHLNMRKFEPEVKLKGADAEAARYTYNVLSDIYTANGHVRHKSVGEHEPVL